MSADKALSWSFAEEFIEEGPALRSARYRAEELGVTCVSPGVGAILRLISASLGAKAVVEIGTGVGVSALWLLSGMAEDGVLTSIDKEAEFHREARQVFSEAKLSSQRTRLITGRAANVLPRMASRAYDLVLADADVGELPGYISHAKRMLRPGGVLVVVHALWHDQVSDPARREADVTVMRQTLNSVREDEDFLPTLMSAGDGVLAAVRL